MKAWITNKIYYPRPVYRWIAVGTQFWQYEKTAIDYRSKEGQDFIDNNRNKNFKGISFKWLLEKQGECHMKIRQLKIETTVHKRSKKAETKQTMDKNQWTQKQRQSIRINTIFSYG